MELDESEFMCPACYYNIELARERKIKVDEQGTKLAIAVYALLQIKKYPVGNFHSQTAEDALEKMGIMTPTETCLVNESAKRILELEEAMPDSGTLRIISDVLGRALISGFSKELVDMADKIERVMKK